MLHDRPLNCQVTSAYLLERLKQLIFLLLFIASGTAARQCFEDAVFVPGAIPSDTDGKQVHAHGGGILQQDGIFFWYGTTQKYPPAWISRGINLYSSADLQNWYFEGQIFADEQIIGAPFSHPYRIERPKILFNREEKEYTMLFHLDTPSFALTSVGVAKAGEIRGPWRWIGAFKPDGRDSYDMTAWQDEEGRGYLARSVENSFLGISRLAKNFTDTDGAGICSQTIQAEAPAIFQPKGGQFFVIASHLTGWAANPALLFASEGKDICQGGLHPVDPPAKGPGSETTFNSQPAFVLPLQFEDGGELFVYIGDRWNFYGQGCVGTASYVWLPLLPRPDAEEGYELVYLPKWRPKDVKDLKAPRRKTSVDRARAMVVDLWRQREFTLGWCKQGLAGRLYRASTGPELRQRHTAMTRR